MSSYSLTEALKHSRYRTLQLQLQQTSPNAVSVHKSSRMMSQRQPPSRRCNDEIVKAPARPWHSPVSRVFAVSSTSSASFSIESNGAGLLRANRNSPKQYQNYFMAPNSFMAESTLTDDRKSVSTEMWVADTISQDPSVSDHYLSERSACIRRSNNCSNSTHKLGSSRRRQRSPRRESGGGDRSIGRHHLPSYGKERRVFCQIPKLPGHRKEWLGFRKVTPSKHIDQSFSISNETRNMMGNSLSGFFANANCLADQLSPSQWSGQTDIEFGREDLKVHGQWQDSLSNEDSVTQPTTTDDRTRSAVQGTDLSALTLSRTELSSTQVVAPRRISGETAGELSPSSGSSQGRQMRPTSIQQMQANEMPTGSYKYEQYPQQQHHLQQQHQQYHQQQLVQQQHTQLQQQHTQLQQQHAQLQQQQLQQQLQQQQPQQHQQQQLPQQQQQQQQYQQGSQASTISRQSMASQHQHHSIGHHSNSPTLANRPTVTAGVRNPVRQHGSNSSFSLNQSDLSSRHSSSGKEEAIPASDDLVHLTVISCSEGATGSEAAMTVQAAGETEAEGEGEEAETTLRAESDRLPESVLAADDAQHQKLTPLKQQKRARLPAAAADDAADDEDDADDTDDAGGGAADPDLCQPSRYGRLKTPEICKRSFLSVLRHSITRAPPHISHRAKIKTRPKRA